MEILRMNRTTIILISAVGGLIIGSLFTLVITTRVVNSNNTTMMKMMGFKVMAPAQSHMMPDGSTMDMN